MRIYIKYLVLVMLLCSCKSHKNLMIKIDKNKAIPYNEYSQEFQEWESTKNIKLDEDYYIFSTVTYNHKMGIFNSTGIWVNANTGEVDYIEVNKSQNFHTDPNIWLTSYNGNKL